MARPTLRRQLDDLLKQFTAEIAAAFRESIADVTSKITLKVLVERLKVGDINGALDALNIDRAAFAPLEDAIARAFASGGTVQAGGLPTLRDATGAKLIIRFDTRNPRAEGWLREHSSQLVTGIIDDQRAAIQGELVKGLAAGQNPTQTSLNVIGRINRATGRRDGGIIGLSGPQTDYLATARAELLSGDPKQMENYLERKLRDKRFDGAVRAAIKSGKPLTVEATDKVAGRYADKMLKYRGDVIGKEETFNAIAASKDEAFAQAIGTGKVNAAFVKKRWKHFPNTNPRHWHESLNNVEVPYDGLFTLSDGTQMRFAHDPKGGARNNLGCHCQTDYFIDFFEGRAN